MTASQERWPYGPAPARECAKGGEHDWFSIGLTTICDPPQLNHECSKCGWRWSRKQTLAEFKRHADGQSEASRAYDALLMAARSDAPAVIAGTARARVAWDQSRHGARVMRRVEARQAAASPRAHVGSATASGLYETFRDSASRRSCMTTAPSLPSRLAGAEEPLRVSPVS